MFYNYSEELYFVLGNECHVNGIWTVPSGTGIMQVMSMPCGFDVVQLDNGCRLLSCWCWKCWRVVLQRTCEGWIPMQFIVNSAVLYKVVVVCMMNCWYILNWFFVSFRDILGSYMNASLNPWRCIGMSCYGTNKNYLFLVWTFVISIKPTSCLVAATTLRLLSVGTVKPFPAGFTWIWAWTQLHLTQALILVKPLASGLTYHNKMNRILGVLTMWM